MLLIEDKQSLRDVSSQWRENKERVALVPTMGGLHTGHLSLVKQALTQADRVIVSIFVNPTQFAPSEDFAAYPRTLAKDCAALRQLGVDAVFAPTAETMFARGYETYVSSQGLTTELCGRSRPDFFRGVLTIVCKLFNLVQPHLAVFGLKDYQQLCAIKRMVDDLDLSIEIIGAPTVRETDGLASSSRNQRLDSSSRKNAAGIYATLRSAQIAYRNGETNSNRLITTALAKLKRIESFETDYCEIRTKADLEAVNDEILKPALLFVAGNMAGIRLIDNIELS